MDIIRLNIITVIFLKGTIKMGLEHMVTWSINLLSFNIKVDFVDKPFLVMVFCPMKMVESFKDNGIVEKLLGQLQ